MRVMDGLMAMPSILLAIAVVSLSGASIWTVMIAITIPEIPRVARLVRSVVLSAREEPYVEAAISVGSSLPKIHVAAFDAEHDRTADRPGHLCLCVCDPHRGHPVLPRRRISRRRRPGANIMAEGRQYFQLKPTLIFWPGLLLSIAILSINLIGDGRPRRARSPHEAAGGQVMTNPVSTSTTSSSPSARSRAGRRSSTASRFRCTKARRCALSAKAARASR